MIIINIEHFSPQNKQIKSVLAFNVLLLKLKAYRSDNKKRHGIELEGYFAVAYFSYMENSDPICLNDCYRGS